MVKLRVNYVKNTQIYATFTQKYVVFYGLGKITGKIRIFYVENT